MEFPSFKLSRKGKIILGACTLAVGIALVIFLVWFEYRALFTENPRFTLRHVKVNSTGWWNGKEAYIEAIADLKKERRDCFSWIRLGSVRGFCANRAWRM